MQSLTHKCLYNTVQYTVKPLYNDTGFNNKICYNDNLNGMIP